MSLLSGLQLLVARFSILCAEACASSTLISTLYCLQLKINLELVSSLVLREYLLPLLIPLESCILSDDLLLSHHAFKLLTHIHSILDDKTMFPLKDIMDKVFIKLNSQSALGRVQAIKFLSYLTHSRPHGELVSILCLQISDQTSASRLLLLGLLEEIIQGYPEHLLLPHLSNLQEALFLASTDSEEDICLSGQIGTKTFSERFPKFASSLPTPNLPHSDTVILEDDGTFRLDPSPTVTSPILFFDSDEDLLPPAPSTRLKRICSISLAKDVPLDLDASLSSQDQRHPTKKLKSIPCSKLSASNSLLPKEPSLTRTPTEYSLSPMQYLVRSKPVCQSITANTSNASSSEDLKPLLPKEPSLTRTPTEYFSSPMRYLVRSKLVCQPTLGNTSNASSSEDSKCLLPKRPSLAGTPSTNSSAPQRPLIRTTSICQYTTANTSNASSSEDSDG
ncbi:hypothetical protein DSO57_1027821 [Entomophthora muscae]|uniref:Uncharacterized protein n=1 Tax=Entomophthora muscae TaxID=34485 RepID=A0ACC2UM98_9FUNG|nr:hypothetical protein DSO57_1027821 [Entomophthora muscae]